MILRINTHYFPKQHQLVFAVEMHCVFSEVETEFSNAIYMSFMLKMLYVTIKQIYLRLCNKLPTLSHKTIIHL
jgi:hypothetical protein